MRRVRKDLWEDQIAPTHSKLSSTNASLSKKDPQPINSLGKTSEGEISRKDLSVKSQLNKSLPSYVGVNVCLIHKDSVGGGRVGIF